MKKKIVSLMLAAAMVVSLAACGKDSGEKKDGDAEKPYDIQMQIVTFGQEFPGLEDVEKAISAITEKEIGATVTLEPIAAWDIPTTTSLAITSQKKIDLMCILPMGSNMDSITNYSSKNMLMPLNDLYAKYGKDIKASIGELEKIGYVGDTLYAIPANYYAGSGAAFVAPTAELTALGFTFDENKIYTLEDIEEVMAAYKKEKKEGFYSIAGFADGDLIGLLAQTDDLGGVAVGSLMDRGLGDTTVVNKYASEEYKEAYTKVRDWYNKGYINPDVISITDTWPALLSTGQYLGAFVATNGTGLDGIVINEQAVGQDLTVIRYAEDVATTNTASYGMWGIPVTCANPEKTMQFLNMLYQDRAAEENISYMLSSGLEGKTYKVVETLDDGRIIIDYADGVDRMTAPYGGQVPVYGDELRTPKFTPIDAAMFDEITNYNSTLKYSKAFGYAFDTSNYASQLAAINNVITTYRAQLGWGTVDVDAVLPQFITELEAAGMNDVIEANQKQLNDWLEEQ